MRFQEAFINLRSYLGIALCLIKFFLIDVLFSMSSQVKTHNCPMFCLSGSFLSGTDETKFTGL